MNKIIFTMKKLRQGNVTRETLIGLLVMLILSKKLFKRNHEVYEYIDNVFNINFLPYITKSRTLIVSKLCRILVELSDQKANKIAIDTYKYIAANYEIEINENLTIKKNNKTNALSNMDKWIDGILNKK